MQAARSTINNAATSILLIVFIFVSSKLKLFYKQISILLDEKDVKINLNQPVSYKKQEKPRILVAPLDWGLGHAARCIPIIRELLVQGCEVITGGSGSSRMILQSEFPTLLHLEAPSFVVRYSKSKWMFPLKMMEQFPLLKKQSIRETNWLNEVVEQYSIDAAISDNRFGMHHGKIPCIFISHQLGLKSGLGKFIDRFIQRNQYTILDKYAACWVPDYETGVSLAGELSHPSKKPPLPLYYLGALSRFERKKQPGKKNHVLVILSGPEPQRTILEKIIRADIDKFEGTVTIVRGLPDSSEQIPSTGSVQYFNHLPAEKLNEQIIAAEYIISRSGYSTLMDIIPLQKKSVLIPTPGQPEQEYLGAYYLKQHMALCIKQKHFSFTEAIRKATDFSYRLPILPVNDKLSDVIRQFVAAIH